MPINIFRDFNVSQQRPPLFLNLTSFIFLHLDAVLSIQGNEFVDTHVGELIDAHLEALATEGVVCLDPIVVFGEGREARAQIRLSSVGLAVLSEELHKSDLFFLVNALSIEGERGLAQLLVMKSAERCKGSSGESNCACDHELEGLPIFDRTSSSLGVS